jgi:hypothetical protein
MCLCATVHTSRFSLFAAFLLTFSPSHVFDTRARTQVHDQPERALELVRRVCSPTHVAVLDWLFRFLADLAQYAAQTRYVASRL